MTAPLTVRDCGIITPLGRGKDAVARKLFKGSRDSLVRDDSLIPKRSVYVGAVTGELPVLPDSLEQFDCRNNRLMLAALAEIRAAVDSAAERYGRDRVAVILGTSTSGIGDGEEALTTYRRTGSWPNRFHYRQQETSSLSDFAARWLNVTGPAYTVATACSSSAKVFASARRLIHAGMADAAVVGGADTLCRMTLNGFNALEALSKGLCNPFSVRRDGINIGEGAAAFLLDREDGDIQFLGAGETSDAHHPTAPDPQGRGATTAMRQALADAGLSTADIGYVNLHGTATPLNDAMEGIAVHDVFGSAVACSSTKAMTGHMLGATGGCEAAFLWLALNPATNPSSLLPPHLWDGEADPAIPRLNLIAPGASMPRVGRSAMLSNTFGFGGSNVALILGRAA